MEGLRSEITKILASDSEEPVDSKRFTSKNVESPTKSHRMHTFSQMFVEKNYGDLNAMQAMLDQSLSTNELIMFHDSRGQVW